MRMTNKVKDKRSFHSKLWRSGYLEKQYTQLNRSIGSIAKEIGCYKGTVINALDKLGIVRRRYTMSKEAHLARKKATEISSRNRRRRHAELRSA